MINGVNGLEFLKPKLSTMDKYNSTTTTKLLPPSSLTQTGTFTTVTGHQNINAFREKQTQFNSSDEVKDQDRVRVQHLENHTKFQNNKSWNNFRTLYNISASSNVRDKEMYQIHQIKDDNELLDVVNVDNSTSTTMTTLNIQNESALTLDLNNKYYNNNGIGGNDNYIGNVIESAKVGETNNNYKFYCKQYNNYGLINEKSLTTAMIVMSTEPDSKRTEDQNNAYRHIESVHNYAKSKSFEGEDDKTSPNGSRHSSYLDDDEDDDDEDNYDDAEYDNDDDIDYEDRLPDDLDADYEDIFSTRRFQKLSTSSDGALSNEINKTINSRGALSELRKPDHFRNKNHTIQPVKVNDEDDVHIDVDVETVEQSSTITSVFERNSLVVSNGIGEESAATLKPDHHARRPMNAFLIFCKRHRAIVKERYKNLENRAITKILGDWWASLDASEKKCFTNLAQQNKDAFFSANPNFKWYKLPAPPLRSLTTRPSNTFSQECQEDNELEMIRNMTRYSNNHNNYFKLADEAQMGDLSQLMQDKSKTTKQCVDLQQVLGETSQYLSAHITGDSENMDEPNLKRRFYNENSFSGHSSEDDIIEPTKKSVRSCKGKRYQELINSGQIATALKKSKPSTRPLSGDGGGYSEMTLKQSNINNDFNSFSNNACQKRSLSESENISYDLNGFDLEERIKELPALNLDDYLQRKRNTKKKKKFSSNGKKRGQRTSTGSNNNCNNSVTSRADSDNIIVKTSQQQVKVLSNENCQQHQQLVKQHQQAATAVGSQKRKARKESITRRDVSAIEQEVASLLPLTINGCCYFQEAPSIIKYKKPIEKDTETNTATSQSLNITSISPIIPSKQNSSSLVSVEILNNTEVSNILNDNISSSTSDLLILAEVAANRTELKN